jgi:hypothetical protein
MAVRSIAGMLALVALLAYLRDPPWLLHLTTGLGARQTDEIGEPYRWAQGRASLFVPSGARSVALTMRALKDTPQDWPINATISIDDRPVQRVSLDDESWRTLTVRLPSKGSRDAARVDIHLDRVRKGQRGVQLREPVLHFN